MRPKTVRATMMAVTMVDRPGRVKTMSAAARAASVLPYHMCVCVKGWVIEGERLTRKERHIKIDRNGD